MKEAGIFVDGQHHQRGQQQFYHNQAFQSPRFPNPNYQNPIYPSPTQSPNDLMYPNTNFNDAGFNRYWHLHQNQGQWNPLQLIGFQEGQKSSFRHPGLPNNNQGTFNDPSGNPRVPAAEGNPYSYIDDQPLKSEPTLSELSVNFSHALQDQSGKASPEWENDRESPKDLLSQSLPDGTPSPEYLRAKQMRQMNQMRRFQTPKGRYHPYQSNYQQHQRTSSPQETFPNPEYLHYHQEKFLNQQHQKNQQSFPQQPHPLDHHQRIMSIHNNQNNTNGNYIEVKPMILQQQKQEYPALVDCQPQQKQTTTGNNIPNRDSNKMEHMNKALEPASTKTFTIHHRPCPSTSDNNLSSNNKQISSSWHVHPGNVQPGTNQSGQFSNRTASCSTPSPPSSNLSSEQFKPHTNTEYKSPGSALNMNNLPRQDSGYFTSPDQDGRNRFPSGSRPSQNMSFKSSANQDGRTRFPSGSQSSSSQNMSFTPSANQDGQTRFPSGGQPLQNMSFTSSANQDGRTRFPSGSQPSQNMSFTSSGQDGRHRIPSGAQTPQERLTFQAFQNSLTGNTSTPHAPGPASISTPLTPSTSNQQYDQSTAYNQPRSPVDNATNLIASTNNNNQSAPNSGNPSDLKSSSPSSTNPTGTPSPAPSKADSDSVLALSSSLLESGGMSLPEFIPMDPFSKSPQNFLDM